MVVAKLSVVQVRDGRIYTSRRAGGRGLPVEHLDGVRDVGGFLDALGTPAASMPHLAERGVPV